MNRDLINIIACDVCGHVFDNMADLCKGCGKKFRHDNGKIYFTENIPADFKETESSKVVDMGRWSDWRKTNYQYFEKSLKSHSNKDVLVDIGAGTLQFKELFQRFKYFGVDFYPFENVSIIADITGRLPLKNEIADIATISNVLEHTPDPTLLIMEIARILKPHGIIVGTVPFLINVHQAPYDYYRYTYIAIQHLLSKAGFKNIEVVPLGTPYETIKALEGFYFKILKKNSASISRSIIKFLYFLSKKIIRMTSSFTVNLEARDDFNLGYGFKAEK